MCMTESPTDPGELYRDGAGGKINNLRERGKKWQTSPRSEVIHHLPSRDLCDDIHLLTTHYGFYPLAVKTN